MIFETPGKPLLLVSGMEVTEFDAGYGKYKYLIFF